MKDGLFCSAIVMGLMVASASAQTTKTARQCSYFNGVQTCTTKTDYGDSTSKMTCSYPNGSISDSTCTIDRTPNAPASETARYSASEEARKEAIRKASGYRDPSGTRAVR